MLIWYLQSFQMGEAFFFFILEREGSGEAMEVTSRDTPIIATSPTRAEPSKVFTRRSRHLISHPDH